MSAEHRAPLRSYKRRSSRVTPGQASALATLWRSAGVEVDGTALDPARLFGRRAPLVLEIGFGMGEATAEMAAAQPDVDVLAAEVHTPGLGALLREIDRRRLTNVRVCNGDAVALLRMLPPAALSEVRVFFPDPWPKRRHWKRRLVSASFLDATADALAPGGRLHVVTDWPHYAAHTRRLLVTHPAYVLVDDVPWRASTRFERQAASAGRPTHDIVAVRP